jgi:hypothetical protein
MHRHMLALVFPLVLALGAGCGDDDSSVVSSHSYKGHENDLDVNYFVNAYKSTVGTRLDDCQTCHKAATLSYDDGGDTVYVVKNACDYCHLIEYPDPDGFNEPQPTTFAPTTATSSSTPIRTGSTSRSPPPSPRP